MSYALGSTAMIESNPIKRVILSWGAWPDTSSGGDPLFLFSIAKDGRPAPTISTAEALTSLKYQVAAAGVAGLALGWLLRRPKAVSANRRRSRRRSH
jgi:hypothetical protein